MSQFNVSVKRKQYNSFYQILPINIEQKSTEQSRTVITSPHLTLPYRVSTAVIELVIHSVSQLAVEGQIE